MTHLRRITQNIDVQPFRDEVAAVPGTWTAERGGRRWQRPATQSIALRGPVKSMIGPCRRRDLHETSYTASAQRFMATRAFLEGFAAEQGGELGRAKILRLLPGRRGQPRFDHGEYHCFRDRYHLVLRGADDSGFKSGEEAAEMLEGELWWFDNKAMQEAYNHGAAERIHLVFDLLPRSRFAQVYGQAAAA